MKGRHVLITGGNSGIGKATAIALARMGATVTITARDPARGQAAVADIRRASGSDAVEAAQLDLASLADVRRFAAEFLAGHPRLHVLVNNAGVLLSDRRLTVDGFERTFAVNYLGHFLLTRLLLDRLQESAPARIVSVSSIAHHGARRLDLDAVTSPDRAPAPLTAYSHSKLAINLFILELAARLQGTGVTANAVHPGYIRTNVGLDGDTRGALRAFIVACRPILSSPEHGARTSVHVASAPEFERTSGRYFSGTRPGLLSRASLDRETAARLWATSERWTGLAPAG